MRTHDWLRSRLHHFHNDAQTSHEADSCVTESHRLLHRKSSCLGVAEELRGFAVLRPFGAFTWLGDAQL